MRSRGCRGREWGPRPALLPHLRPPPRGWRRSGRPPLRLVFAPHSTHQGRRLAAPHPYRADAGVPRGAEQGAEEGQQAAAPPGWGSAASPLPPLHRGAHPCTCSGRESRAWPTAHAPRPESEAGDAMQLNPIQFLEVINAPTRSGLFPRGRQVLPFRALLRGACREVSQQPGACSHTVLWRGAGEALANRGSNLQGQRN